MDTNQFRKYGKELVDYMCDYMDNIHERRVTPDVEPGFLTPLLPKEAPQKGEPWPKILKDVDDKLMQGILHWQHPHFHAYFPNGNSYASIMGDMLSDLFGALGFSWASSPAGTELETVVMDWFAKALNLPSHFMFSEQDSIGGGSLQGSASDCILIAMIAARNQALKYLAKKHGLPARSANHLLPKLVAYTSEEAHSCVQKAALLCLVQLRILETDEEGSLRGSTVKKAMEEDLKSGLHPFFVSATVGTTGLAAFDNLEEIGPIVRSATACWLHVDGAYGGNSFICPEMRYLMKGIEHADSFNTNCNKWLLIAFDCSCLWVKDKEKLTTAMNVDPVYLQHGNSDNAVDYRHWGIPLSRRMRALKLWFTLRNYGIEGLQKYIRNHCRLAKYLESLVKKDDRFEVVNKVRTGLVCVRLQGSDKLNHRLLSSLNGSGEVHMVPSVFKGRYLIRICITHQHSTEQYIDKSWKIVQRHATEVLQEKNATERRPSRRLSKRHSFVQSVPREVLQTGKRNSLQGGGAPIYVPDDDSEDDDVFA